MGKIIALRQYYSRFLILVVVGWTIYHFVQIGLHSNPLGGDERDYHALAENLLKGNGFTVDNNTPTAWRTPGFPVLLAVIYFFLGDDIFYARSVAVLITGFTSIVIYLLCNLLVSVKEISIMSGLLYLSSLSTNVMASALYGENFSALLIILSLYFLSRVNKRDGARYVLFAGLLVGWAVLTRGYVLPIVGVQALWLWNKGKLLMVIFMVTSAAVILGWCVRNNLLLDAFTLSTESAQVLWMGNNAWTRGSWPGEWEKSTSGQRQYLREKYPEFDSGNEVLRANIFKAEFISDLINNPNRIAWLIPRKIGIYLWPGSSYLGFDWGYALFAPFAVIGAFTLIIGNSYCRQLLSLMAGHVIGVMIICIMTFGDTRFRQPIMPMICILASIGMLAAIYRSPLVVDGEVIGNIKAVA